MSLLAPDLDLIENFLAMIGDRKLRMRNDGKIVLIPPPAVMKPLAAEIMESLQPFLQHAYFGAAVRPRVPPSWPWKCPACRSWSMQTVQRSKTRCYCGTKLKRELIVIPWYSTNHHRRPTKPHYRTMKQENTK